MWQWRLALPEVSFHAVLGQVRQRWRIRAIALAVAVAGAAFAGAIVLTSMSIALGAFAIALLVTLVRGVSLSNAGAASLVERQAGGLDNLLVTAAELAEKPRPVRAEIVDLSAFVLTVELTRYALHRAMCAVRIAGRGVTHGRLESSVCNGAGTNGSSSGASCCFGAARGSRRDRSELWTK